MTKWKIESDINISKSVFEIGLKKNVLLNSISFSCSSKIKQLKHKLSTLQLYIKMPPVEELKMFYQGSIPCSKHREREQTCINYQNKVTVRNKDCYGWKSCKTKSKYLNVTTYLLNHFVKFFMFIFPQFLVVFDTCYIKLVFGFGLWGFKWAGEDGNSSVFHRLNQHR